MTQVPIDIVVRADRANADGQKVIRTLDGIKQKARENQVATDGLNKSLGNLARGVGAIEGPFGGFASRLSSLKTLTSSTGFALGGFTLSLAGATLAMRESVRAATDFNKAMAEVSTLVSDDFNIPELTQNIRNLSKEFGKIPADQAKAAYQIISAGASSAAEATTLLTAANKLAIGGVTDVKIAADGLTSILNGYGKSATEATSVSDSLFTAMKSGKTTIFELSSNIGKVAPLAAQAGTSLNELLSATASLTKSGVSTSEAVTGLRAILAAVVKPTKEASKVASSLGLDFSAAALKGKGFASFLEDVKNKTGGSTDALAQLFGGVEALVPVLALTGTASKDFANILELMQHNAGETEKAVSKMSETAAFTFDKLSSQFGDVGLSIGDTLLYVIVPAAQVLSDNFDNIIEVTEILAALLAGKLITSLVSVAAQFAITTAAALVNTIQVASLAAAVGGTTTAFVVMQGVLTTTGTILTALAGPIALGAVIGGYFILKANVDSVGEAMNALQAVMTVMFGGLGKLGNYLNFVADVISKSFTESFKQVGNIFDGFVQDLSNFLSNPLDFKGFENLGNALSKGFGAGFKKAFDDSKASLDSYNASIDSLVDEQLLKLSKKNQELSKTNETLAESTETVAVAIPQVTKTASEASNVVEKLTEKLADATSENIKAVEQARLLSEANSISSEEYDHVSESLAIKNQLEQQGFVQGTKLYEINKKLLEQEGSYKDVIEQTNEARKVATEEAKRLQEELERPFNNAADALQRTFKDTFKNIISGGINSFKDFGKAIKSIFFDLAAELVTLQFIGPQGISLKGILGNSSTGSSISGSGGGIGSLASGGSSILDLFRGRGGSSLIPSGIAGSIDKLGYNIFGIGQSVVGPTTGAATGVKGIVSGVSSNFTPGTALAGIGGSLAANLLGLSGKYSGVTGTLGGIAGSFGGPIGAAVGSFLGSALGGVFGGGKPHPASNFGAVIGDGGSFSELTLKSKHGTTETAKALSDSLSKVTTTLTGLGFDLKGKVIQGGVDNGQGFFGASGKNYLYDKANGVKFDPRGGEKAVDQALATLTLELAKTSTKGVELAETLKRVQSQGSSAEQVLSDLSFVMNFEDIFKDAEEPITQTKQAMDAINTQYDTLRATMERLGYSVKDVNRLESKRNDDLNNLKRTLYQDTVNAYIDDVAPAASKLRELFEAFAEKKKEFEGSNIDTTFLEKDYRLQQERAMKELSDQFYNDRIDQIKAEGEAASKLADQYSSIVKSLDDAILALRLSDISPVSKDQKLNEARSAFTSTASRAASGDTQAISELQGVGNTFLNLSRDYYASTEDFVRDFNLVEKGLKDARAVASNQLSQQMQLVSNSNKQVELLQGGFSGLINALSSKDLLAQAQALNATNPISDFNDQKLLSMFPNTANSIYVRNRDQINAAGYGDTFKALLDSYTYGTQGGSGRQAIFLQQNKAQNDALIQVARQLGIPGFASGGTMLSNQVALVGEKAPELYRAGSNGGKVIPLQNGDQIEQRLEALEREMKASNNILQYGFKSLIEVGQKHINEAEKTNTALGRA
jgi:TP901 family phage tail tape measure protein